MTGFEFRIWHPSADTEANTRGACEELTIGTLGVPYPYHRGRTRNLPTGWSGKADNCWPERSVEAWRAAFDAMYVAEPTDWGRVDLLTQAVVTK